METKKQPHWWVRLCDSGKRHNIERKNCEYQNRLLNIAICERDCKPLANYLTEIGREITKITETMEDETKKIKFGIKITYLLFLFAVFGYFLINLLLFF